MWQRERERENRLIDTEKRLVVARGRGVGCGKIGEGGPKVQTSSYEISKSWGCHVQHVVQLIPYSRFGNCQEVDHKSYHHKKNIFVTLYGEGC